MHGNWDIFGRQFQTQMCGQVRKRQLPDAGDFGGISGENGVQARKRRQRLTIFRLSNSQVSNLIQSWSIVSRLV